jgi:hypothetical protein
MKYKKEIWITRKGKKYDKERKMKYKIRKEI